MNTTFVVEKTVAEIRQDAIRECLVWLSLNQANYKPEYLASAMAGDLLVGYSPPPVAAVKAREGGE